MSSWKLGVRGPRKGGLLDRVLAPWRFASLAAHQSIESDKIRPILSFSEEYGGIHDRQFFRNGRGNKLINAHAISLGATLDFCSNRAWQPKQISALRILGHLILRKASADVSTSMPKLSMQFWSSEAHSSLGVLRRTG